MTTIKLKYKIEILQNLIKLNPSDFTIYQPKSLHEDKPKSNIKSIPHKPSFKSLASNNCESLPGYEKEINQISEFEKEEITNLIKSINFQNLATIFETLNRKHFYKKIKSNSGLDLIKNSFNEILNLKDVKLNLETDNSKKYFIFDECELFVTFSNIFNISDLNAMDLFDLFKYNQYFAITEQNFILIIYMFSAIQDGDFTDFMHLFYEDLFNFISGGENFISIGRLKQLSIILGLIEFEKSIMKMNIELSGLIDISKFKELYLNLALLYDNLIKSEKEYSITVTENANFKNK